MTKIPQAIPDEAAEQARYDHLHAEAKRVGMERQGEWKGFNATYWFRCRNGHEVKRYMRPFDVLSTLPECQPCLRIKRFQQLRTTAQQAGVSLISKQWLGIAKLHQYRCAQSHTWEKLGSTALHSADCPVCNGGRHKSADKLLLPDGLKRLREAAKRQGGECLSQRYRGVDQKYEFRCAEGHVWQTRGAAIMSDSQWCPRCRHQPSDRETWRADGLARLQKVALQHGGACLSHDYQGATRRYHFRCDKGHEWETTANIIFAGSWCKACVTLSQRRTIEEARSIAESRGGQCLSTEYLSARRKLQWLCHHGHSWQAALTKVGNGTWCPTCKYMNRMSSSKSKARLRYVPVPQ
ncbi:MAG: hypothetical protein QM805_08515 [Pseudomonas sp.]